MRHEAYGMRHTADGMRHEAYGIRHEADGRRKEGKYRVNLETHPDTERTIAEYSKAVLAKLRRDPLRQTARIVRRQLREWNQHRGQRDVTAGTNTVRVPGMLQPPSLKYAGYAGPWLEEHYLRNYREFESTGATYLPILWDNFFAQAQAHSYWPQEFARRFRAMWKLLGELGREDRAFFTLLGIYEFPIWNWHLFPENIIVFAAAGYGDIPIPLLFRDRPYRNPRKTIRCSFLGRTETHSLRERMRHVFQDVAVFDYGSQWEETMGSSVFSLCPRGQGPTSFRIHEAMSLGSIPVIIWENWKWLPYESELDWNSFAVIAEAAEMEALKSRIIAMRDEEIRNKQRTIQRIYPERFTYDAVGRWITKCASKIQSLEQASTMVGSRGDFRF